MEIQNIVNYLENNEVKNKEVLLNFLKQPEDKYLRKNLFGHITGTSFIVDEKLERTLLILHAKYNEWMTPGGHVDEGETALDASRRETLEEVGIKNMNLLQEEIFDIDIHRCQGKMKDDIWEPEHWHFDVVYVYKTSDLNVNLNLQEAHDYKWVNLEELVNFNDEALKRRFYKIKKIKNELEI